MAKRILIIDDEPLVLEMFAEILASTENQVITAPNAKTGMQALKSGSFDVVLIDVCLEVHDGFEIAKYAKQRDPNVRVVLLSGQGDFAQSEMVRKKEAIFLTKPVSPKALRDLVEFDPGKLKLAV